MHAKNGPDVGGQLTLVTVALLTSVTRLDAEQLELCLFSGGQGRNHWTVRRDEGTLPEWPNG
jgi:hypothetical protein